MRDKGWLSILDKDEKELIENIFTPEWESARDIELQITRLPERALPQILARIIKELQDRSAT